MAKSCCGKPIARIIRVRDFEAGIVGLDTAMQNVYRLGIKEKEQVETELLRSIKEYGNYITPDTEVDYKEALWREYQRFIAKRNSE